MQRNVLDGPGDALEAVERSPLRESGRFPDASLVRKALQQILESEYFRASSRGKQFLTYVVQYRLENPAEPLKERMIGAALFNRPLDYATGDDSVVRAQAREVRRRLDRYYAAHPDSNLLKIELPVGSYTPEFRVDRTQDLQSSSELIPNPTALRPVIQAFPQVEVRSEQLPSKSVSKRWMILIVLVVVASCALFFLSRAKPSNTPLAEFWAPATGSTKPLLVCLPKPIFYRPSYQLYMRSAQKAGEFDKEVDRMNLRPHLKPEDPIKWGDMVEYPDYGVSQGDTEAAVRVSNFLATQGKDTELRFGSGYTFEDLRNSPAVVVGAFSNPWTMDMTAGLHFAFVDDGKGIRIQEQGKNGRSWFTKHGADGEDYGLVTRLVDSNTGQFVVMIAGIEASGSDAAADLIVSPDNLARALKDAKNWPQKNVQIVVRTPVKDAAAGPPYVVATHVW